jgi:hypothetical protein
MKPWFLLTILCWALVCLLLSLSQQPGLNRELQVVGSGQWLDRCGEAAFGSPAAAAVRGREYDQARAGPLESVALGDALTVGNIGPPCQETHGPPKASRAGRVAGQSRQLEVTHRVTLIYVKFPAFNLANRRTEFCNSL